MLWWPNLARPHLNAALLILALAAPSGAAGDIAFVTCQNGNALSVLDLDRGVEIARWSVPGQPAGIAVAANGEVFTVAPDSKTVRRHDGMTGAVLAKVTLDGGPMGIAYDPTRARLFVSDWYNARVWVLDAVSLAVTGELTVGAAPAGLDLSDDDRFLAIAGRDADQVYIFDTDSLALRHQLDVGTRPFGLRFAPDGRLFVGNVGSNDVSILDVVSGTLLATVPVGERPYGVAFAAGRAFVSNQYEDTISVISLDQLQHETKISVGEYPEGIDATADGNTVVVTNWFDNTVTLIDANTLSVLRELETGDGPRAFGDFLLGGKK